MVHVRSCKWLAVIDSFAMHNKCQFAVVSLSTRAHLQKKKKNSGMLKFRETKTRNHTKPIRLTISGFSFLLRTKKCSFVLTSHFYFRIIIIIIIQFDIGIDIF